MEALTVDLTRRTWELFRERKGTKGCYKRCSAHPSQPKREKQQPEEIIIEQW